jgi:hypothetical protein
MRFVASSRKSSDQLSLPCTKLVEAASLQRKKQSAEFTLPEVGGDSFVPEKDAIS